MTFQHYANDFRHNLIAFLNYQILDSFQIIYIYIPLVWNFKKYVNIYTLSKSK